MIARKAKIVRQTNDGILYLFRKNKITFLNGRGFFVTSDEDGYLIGVEGRDETRVFAKNVVLATGSKPRQFPGVPFDEERILSNEGALKLKSVPSSGSVPMSEFLKPCRHFCLLRTPRSAERR